MYKLGFVFRVAEAEEGGGQAGSRSGGKSATGVAWPSLGSAMVLGRLGRVARWVELYKSRGFRRL